MSGLLRAYGGGLVSLFFGAVILWGALLIILPQMTMLERALTPPKRQLDSSIAGQLERDADTCYAVLQRYLEPAESAPPADGGLAVPSAGGMAVPSAAILRAGNRSYILQCDRATTRQQMVRPRGQEAWLHELHGLPLLAVSETDPIPAQIETAAQVSQLAGQLHQWLLTEEADQSNLSLNNFAELVRPTLIPLSDEQRARYDADILKQVYELMGLRFEQDGQVFERIGLIILVRTLLFAVMATLLALVVCYPIAYKLALATTPERALWLFVGLVIPYAIVELMRVYAWTAIIDNRGVINSLLDWVGFIDMAAGEAIQFKRSAITVFVVIVYTYVLFMVFPIYNVMSTLDRNQIEAARDLGSSTWRVHWRVIIPHAKPGIAVGCIATFMLAAGAFSVPRIISRGLQSEWFSQTIYNKFFESENSNIGAAYSFSYTLLCFVVVGVFMWVMRTRLKDFARAQ